MSKRYAFSNGVLDAMIKRAALEGFTRDVPDKVTTEAFPARDDKGLFVTPASESDAGRGKPYIDIHNAEVPISGCGGMTAPWTASYKISKEGRNPRNAVLTTGTGPLGGGVQGHNRHMAGIIDGLEKGTASHIPLILLNYNEAEDRWYQCVFPNPAAVVMGHPPVPASGKRGVPAVYSVKRVKSGGRYLEYTALRFNIKPCVKHGYTKGWEALDGAPTLPTEISI